MLSSFRKSLLILLCSFLLLGCGYRLFSASGKVRKIYIGVWKDYSSEPGFGALIASELRKSLVESGKFVPVFNKKEAGYLVVGKVNYIYLTPVGYLSFSKVSEVKIEFCGDYQVIDRTTGKVLVSGEVKRSEVYEVPVGSPEERGLAKEEALKKLAEDVVELISQQILFNIY
ncbi:MAG: hypothetical protein GXO57_01355 [Thermodesulfobacteria bacterium]|nr:hypothetical protein [Thermodesulfobacteriota bacterium]